MRGPVVGTERREAGTTRGRSWRPIILIIVRPRSPVQRGSSRRARDAASAAADGWRPPRRDATLDRRAAAAHHSLTQPSRTEVAMSTRNYRITVLGCALAWFLVGLHLPGLHGVVEHGQAPHTGVLVATLLLAVAAVAGLWALLRAPAARR
jgi:hypothetical protein